MVAGLCLDDSLVTRWCQTTLEQLLPEDSNGGRTLGGDVLNRRVKKLIFEKVRAGVRRGQLHGNSLSVPSVLSPFCSEYDDPFPHLSLSHTRARACTYIQTTPL